MDDSRTPFRIELRKIGVQSVEMGKNQVKYQAKTARKDALTAWGELPTPGK
jgi:hypothetical protein